MKDKVFLDTHFILYVFSEDEPIKQEICKKLLLGVQGKGNCVVSTQVLKEFAHVMIRKFQVGPMKVKEIISDLEKFEIVKEDGSLIKSAIDIHILYNFSFWDSLVLASAQSANCTILFSEDMQNGQKVGSVEIKNPFKK